MFRIDLEKYPEVKRKLVALLGDKVDLTQLAVFEGLANDTLPIKNAGGIYKDARMTPTYLSGMVEKVLNGDYVPIIELHDQHYRLPVGRIFDAATFDTDDTQENQDLHILFYIDKSETKLIDKLSSGTIAEISTGTSPASLQCSSCGYDFLASEDNRRRLWAGKNYTPLCSEGHQWGVGGNHLKMAKLGSWRETSAVTRGAVTRAHILSEKELRLANQTSQISLAAHGYDDKLLLVTLFEGENGPEFNGSTPQEPTDGNRNMTDITVPRNEYNTLVLAQGKADQLEASLSTANAEKEAAEQAKLAAEQAKTAAEDAKATSDAELAAANEKITTLEAQIAVLKNGGGDQGKGTGNEGGEDDQPANLSMGLDPSYFKIV